MNKEYNKYFDLFHKEKSLFESSKKKYSKCEGCEKDKVLIEKDNKLLFNCGSNSGECGDQFEIILPEYVNYHYGKKRLNELINGSFNYNEDINNLSEYNLEDLNKYKKVSDELKKQIKNKKKSEEEKNNLEKEFKSLNDINKRKDIIQEYNAIKQKSEIKKRKLLKELSLETTTDDKKREIKKEYAKLIYEDQKTILPLIEELNKKINHEIKIKEEEIKIHNHKDKKDKDKPKKKTTEKNNDTNKNEKLIELMIDKFKKNDGILTKIEFKKITEENDFKTKWSSLLFKSLQKKEK